MDLRMENSWKYVRGFEVLEGTDHLEVLDTDEV